MPSVLLRAFSSGELDPGLSVRGDLDLYSRGLHTCRNFVVRRSGGVQSRPGLEHVETCKNASATYLLAYIFAAADLCYVIEAGENYFRFHHRTRGMVQELATPYPASVFGPSPDPLYWHQAAGVIVLTHLGYAPTELAMTATDVFALTTTTFGPALAAPAGLAVVAGVAGTGTFYYVVTSVQAETYEESLPSAPFMLASAGVGLPETPHQLSWTAVTGAAEYKVYRADGETNTFGYLGTATGVETFSDIGVAMDYGFTPPIDRAVFADPLHYPATAAVHQQRRIYGGTSTWRDEMFASRIALPANFTDRSPLQDDDAIIWRTVSKELQVIRHMVSLSQQLVVLTDRGEWTIRGDAEGGLTPTTIYPDPVGYVGAGHAIPAIYGDRLLFTQARDVTVRELVLGARNEGISGRDLTRNAAHLFRGETIVSMAFSLIPDPVLWCVRSDGVLLGMTYVPDEDVLAWHHHDTLGGLFEQVVVVPEPEEDAVYVIVNRGGVRTLERMGIRGDPETLLALDRARRVRGHALTAITGLAHLAGKTVRAVADGRPLPPRMVSMAGVLAVPTPADVVDVGIAIEADLETLDLDVGGTDVRDKRKKVTALAFLVENSLQNFEAGPDEDHLREVRAAQWQDQDDPISGRIELAPTGTFNDEGRVFLRHSEPTTLTVLGVFPTVDIGG